MQTEGATQKAELFADALRAIIRRAMYDGAVEIKVSFTITSDKDGLVTHFEHAELDLTERADAA